MTRSRGAYATATLTGRAHATKHHFVAERFFGRSKNRPGTCYPRIFTKCPWDAEGASDVFCYECHELLLHNPVFLPEDIAALATLAKRRGLDEGTKEPSYDKLAGRIVLLHDVMAAGLRHLTQTIP